MRVKRDISQDEFIDALCIVAAVLGDGLWQNARMPSATVKRPGDASPVGALDCERAAKYCGFGRTRFRQLVSTGIFPPPIIIERRKRWLTKDLDISLARLRKSRGGVK
jgi:predicted DNA-binding transcriptional regulator AlpA